MDSKIIHDLVEDVFSLLPEIDPTKPEHLKIVDHAHKATYLAEKLSEPKIPTFDLDVLSWERIKAAARESKWIPPEYCINDWENDVCEFLREGINIDLLKKVWAHGYNAGHNEGIGCGHPLAGRCRHQGDSEAEANVDDIQRILKGD